MTPPEAPRGKQAHRSIQAVSTARSCRMAVPGQAGEVRESQPVSSLSDPSSAWSIENPIAHPGQIYLTEAGLSAVVTSRSNRQFQGIEPWSSQTEYWSLINFSPNRYPNEDCSQDCAGKCCVPGDPHRPRDDWSCRPVHREAR